MEAPVPQLSTQAHMLEPPAKQAKPSGPSESDKPKVKGGASTYFVSVPTGIESVARAEIEEKLQPSIIEEHRGKVFFVTNAPPASIVQLKSVEHLYVVADVRSFVSPAAADQVEDELLSIKKMVRDELELWGPLNTWLSFRKMENLTKADTKPAIQADEDWKAISFKCHCYRSGEKSKILPSLKVAGFIGGAFLERFSDKKWRVDLKNGELEIYIYLNDDLLMLAFPLMSERLSKREMIGRGETGILKPCVSYAMARLAEIKEGDTVLDPMCGNGTLLLEGITSWPRALYWGGDIDLAVLQSAAKNMRVNSVPVAICRWDATSLPIASDSIDIILCDIPWGKRHGNKADNRKLYPLLFEEFHRVLRTGGRAVLITTMDRIMWQYLFGKVGKQLWDSIPRRFVNVGNLDAYIYVLSKKRKMEVAKEKRPKKEQEKEQEQMEDNAVSKEDAKQG